MNSENIKTCGCHIISLNPMDKIDLRQKDK